MTRRFILRSLRKGSPRLEALFFLGSFVVFLGLTHHLFVSGDRILRHENLGKLYPLFYFSIENLLSGHFPYWNPYSHAGEPFYPLLGQYRLFDPLTLLVTFIGSVFTRDTVLLLNWNRLAQTVVIVLGSYLLLRRWAKALPLRLSLVPILFFSSFTLGSFQQDGIISQFLWVPFFLCFLFRILADRDYRWFNWAGAAGLFGLNWQSYFFSGPLTLVLLLTVGIAISRPEMLKAFVSSGRNRWYLLFSLGLIVLMMAPDLALLREKGRFVFPDRMIPADHGTRAPIGSPEPNEGETAAEMTQVTMPYSAIAYSGSFSSIWDYVQMATPSGNGVIHSDHWIFNFGQPTEAFLYLGQLTLLMALFGFFLGRDPFKRAWGCILIGFGLLTLGPSGGLHRALYAIFPPLWFIRHTHALVLFVELAVLYFYVLGVNELSERWRRKELFPSPRRHRVSAIIASTTGLLWILIQAAHAGNGAWLVPHLAAAFSLVAVCAKISGRESAFLSVLLTWLIFACASSPERQHFLLFTYSFLILPPILFYFLRRDRRGLNRSKARLALGSFFLVTLVADLLCGFLNCGLLTRGEAYPPSILPIEARAQPPSAPSPRAIYANHFPNGIRYTSLLMRHSYALSEMAEPNRADLSFTQALKEKRLDSFILLERYFALLHSGISSDAMQEMFAIDSPPFQLKKGLLAVEPGNLPEWLNHLGPVQSRELLRKYSIVDAKDLPSSPRELVTRVGSEEEFARLAKEPTPANFRYSVDGYSHNRFGLNFSLPHPGVLYWADGYDANWRAYDGDREIPILRANGNFKALMLPQGEINLRLVYDPVAFRMALMLFYATFVFAMGFPVAHLLTRYREGAEETPPPPRIYGFKTTFTHLSSLLLKTL